MKSKTKKVAKPLRSQMIRIDETLYKKMRMISLVDGKSLGALTERALNRVYKSRLEEIKDMKIKGL